MAEPECVLTELPASQCACPKHRGGDAPGLERIETVGQAFVAQYGGRCAGCDRGIRIGDEIARVADQSGEYVHARTCAEVEPT